MTTADGFHESQQQEASANQHYQQHQHQQQQQEQQQHTEEQYEMHANLDQNQAESQRFVDVAVREMNAGNYDAALKLLNRAHALHPNPKIMELQSLIRKMRADHEHMNNGSNNDSYVRSRRKFDNNAAYQQRAGTPAAEDYTPQQLTLVQKVNKCSNFYQVLNVSHEATESEIKKAYKRLALQLHPDKNRAPGAVEAFKTVGNAVAVLTDDRKRKIYDANGANSLNASGTADNISSPYAAGGRAGQHHYYHTHGNAFEATFGADDITAEELFNMFFGNFQGHARPQRRTYQSANQRQPTSEHSQQPSLAFGLILVLILISMMSSFFTSDPVYNLVQSSKYPMRRETQHLSVPYYVKANFESDYQGSLGRLENSVEEDFIYTMKQNCYRERSYREAMMARARSFGSRAQFAQAQGLKMPSCDNLSKIGITRYSLY